jgi:hypothetical protein
MRHRGLGTIVADYRTSTRPRMGAIDRDLDALTPKTIAEIERIRRQQPPSDQDPDRDRARGGGRHPGIHIPAEATSVGQLHTRQM